ncbi:hypothetical protein LP52_00550 [Streptomonospora alba]|uniref:Uncharacterized protein n=1 Tax=Streptomonospora alba TaxID=183763 RepID=A0A0C2JUJ9_9ACTN|nr:hypothetical protein LP52_00550 [Streptomonospora alba]
MPGNTSKTQETDTVNAPIAVRPERKLPLYRKVSLSFGSLERPVRTHSAGFHLRIRIGGGGTATEGRRPAARCGREEVWRLSPGVPSRFTALRPKCLSWENHTQYRTGRTTGHGVAVVKSCPEYTPTAQQRRFRHPRTPAAASARSARDDLAGAPS